jgi:hydroxylamine oxidation protein HaoB
MKMWGKIILLALLLLIFGGFGCVSYFADIEPGKKLPYEYVKVEDIPPENFDKIEGFKTAIPLQSIVKYEQKVMFGYSIGEGELEEKYTKGEIISIQYLAKFKWGERNYEIPIYVDGIPAVSQPWRDGFEWIKEHTEEDALILTWWDYGPYCRLFGGRETIIAGYPKNYLRTVSTYTITEELGEKYGEDIITYEESWFEKTRGFESRGKIEDIATMFCSPENEALEIIKKYNPENKPVYVIVSNEEFGKSGAINYIANDQLFLISFPVSKTGNPEADQRTLQGILGTQISTYYVIDYGTYYLVWGLNQRDEKGELHPEWSDKLLAKLLPFNTGYGQGLKHFQLVYQNGHVYVYNLTSPF